MGDNEHAVEGPDEPNPQPELQAQRALRDAAAELLAVPDPEPLTPARFDDLLQTRLSEIEHEANALLAEYAEDEPRRCPLLHPSALADVVQRALAEEAPGFGHAWAELARVYPVERQTDPQDFANLVPPVVPLALAVRLDDALALRVGISQARKVSPGTTWDDLKPWRAKVKPQTRAKRLRTWLADAEEPPLEVPFEVAQAWLSEAREHAAEEAAVRAGLGAIDPPSDKQLAFVRSLIEQKGLDEARLGALLLEVGGVHKLEHLDRQHASPLIEALLALPNAPRAKPKPKRKPKAAAGKATKLSWSGRVLAVRPRIKAIQLAGELKHNYPGYVLALEGTLGEAERRFDVGLGKAAQAKHGFRVGDTVSGAGVPVDDPQRYGCDLHKASKLKREPGPEPSDAGPPWQGAPEPLEVYRAAGHRPLGDGALDADPCASCVWACRMPTEQTAGDVQIEAVCYGPADCPAYAPF